MNIFKRTLTRIRTWFKKQSPLVSIALGTGVGMAVNFIPLPASLKPIASQALRSLIGTVAVGAAITVCYGYVPGEKMVHDALFYGAVAGVASIVEIPVSLGTTILTVWKLRMYLKLIYDMFKAKGNDVTDTNFKTNRVTLEGEYNEIMA